MPNIAISLPLFIYLQHYLIDFMELQYSTLQWVANAFDKSGQYETIVRLSTMISFPLTFITIVLPLSSSERRRYNGYPSIPLIVSLNKGRGKSFVHFPFSMHCESGLWIPQGPCIIFVVTTECSFESVSGSGISAEKIKSI